MSSNTAPGATKIMVIRHAEADEAPSQRPYETLTALASKLVLKINTDFSKKHYAKMLKDAIQQDGIVLICWQHEDIPLRNSQGQPGISQCILTMTGTNGTMDVPSTWLMDIFLCVS
jgi:hypothetical protein